MTMKIILESDGEKQVEITLDPSKYDDKDWEKVCDATGNNIAREAAIRWLEFIEEGLFCSHPKELEVEGFRSRQRATAFGKFSIRRILYSEKVNDKGNNAAKDNNADKDPRYHFLLDEHLNWTPYVRRTPDTKESFLRSYL